MSSEIGRLLGISADARTFKQDSRLVLPECRIGVECEFEGVKKPLPTDPELRYWTPHREDSLRNNGQEYVFSEPMFGEDAYRAVEWLLSRAKTAGYQTSIRTGLHVHVDARDLDSKQFRNLCLIYAYVEPVLFQWVGDNREESVYCVPWYYADQSLGKGAVLLEAMEKDSKKDETELSKLRAYNTDRAPRLRTIEEEDGVGSSQTARSSANYERYAAFNLNALHKFGSVEFRHMKMTLDFTRTIRWINMLLSMKRHAMNSVGDVYAEILAKTPITFFNDVFGPTLFAELLDSCKGSFKEKAALGAQSCADLVRLTKQRTGWGSSVPKRLQGSSLGASKFAQRFGKPTPKAAPTAAGLNTAGVDEYRTMVNEMYIRDNTETLADNIFFARPQGMPQVLGDAAPRFPPPPMPRNAPRRNR